MDGWMTFWFYDVNTVLTIELTIPQLLLSFCVWIWLWSPSTLWIACWFWELLNIPSPGLALLCRSYSYSFFCHLSSLRRGPFLPPASSNPIVISDGDSFRWFASAPVCTDICLIHGIICLYIYICTIMLYHLFVYVHFMYIRLFDMNTTSTFWELRSGLSQYWVETCHVIFILEVLNGEVTIMVGLRMRLENWFRSWQWSHQRHGKLKVMRKQLIQMFEVGDDCGWFREGSRWF